MYSFVSFRDVHFWRKIFQPVGNITEMEGFLFWMGFNFHPCVFRRHPRCVLPPTLQVLLVIT